MPTKTPAHVQTYSTGVDKGGFGCYHCGEIHRVVYPISIPMMMGTMEAFIKIHKKCKARPNALAQMREDAEALKPITPQGWMESTDTGLSSLTIHSVLGNYSLGERKPSTPHDPSDFGRCYRLVKRIAGWEARLPEVAVKYPAWKPIVDNWAELASLYEEERPTGTAPKLYARMKTLNGESR